MNKRKVMFLILMTCLVVPCFAQNVTVDYNKDFNFAAVRTYRWENGTPADPLMEQRIVKAIESQLARSGLQKSDSAPDVLVATHTSAKEDVRLTEWGQGPFRWSGTTIDIQKILVGALIVDILDAKDKQLVWRAIATGTLSNKPEKVEAKINKAAEKMFNKFPPATGSK